VNRALVRVAVAGALATGFLVALSVGFPGERWNFAAGFELVVGAAALASLLGGLRALVPRGFEARTPFDAPSRSVAPAEVPPDLERIDRLLVLGTANAFDAHHRVRPLLRELASERLHAHYGVDLDRQTERAHELLGDDLWSIVRADAELGHRSAPGLPLERVARLVDELEAV
jgi:hypothetical protein